MADNETQGLGADIVDEAVGEIAQGTDPVLALEKATRKRVLQAFVFPLSVFLPILVWTAISVDTVPTTLLILGSMAVAIAVQQFYLFGASEDAPLGKAYFWGAWALVGFGLSAALVSASSPGQILPNELLVAGWRVQRGIDVLHVPLTCLALVCLYRFVVIYLFRDAEMLNSNKYRLSIFTSKWPKLRKFDACFFGLGLLSIPICTMLEVVFWQVPMFSTSANFWTDTVATDFYRLSPFSASLLLFFLVSSYAVSFEMYRRRFTTISNGDGILSTLRFFQAMLKIFYIPFILQAGVLGYICFTRVTNGSTVVVDIGDVPKVVLIIFCLLLILIPIIVRETQSTDNTDGPELEKDKEVRTSIANSMLFPYVAIFLLSWSFHSFVSLPLPYMSLGFLTLGFAYLPANDLINARSNATTG